jgi:hypothetical protein
MGRSPFFTLSQVELSSPTSASDALNDLKVGQLVRFSFGQYIDVTGFSGIHRSISTYQYSPSAVSNNITYEVTSIDAIPAFDELGLRVISLIDINHHDPKMHMNGWYITTDGYVRECEHFGIQFIINDVFVL